MDIIIIYYYLLTSCCKITKLATYVLIRTNLKQGTALNEGCFDSRNNR